MRVPEGPGERRAVDERGGTGQARAAGDDLRQRLDRLAACHPSSPDYRETGLDHEETRPGYGDPEPEYGDMGPDYDPAGAGAGRALDAPDRQAARSDGRDGEPGQAGPGTGGRPRPGTPGGLAN